MPPKIKVTKENIIDAAVDIVRKEGAQAINARNLAAVLNCSTQPIFSNFATMEQLRLSVLDRATEIYNDYIRREIENEEYPAYKASGLAYIRFAREERELFKLLYMRDCAIEIAPETIDFGAQMESIVQDSTGLNEADWKLFHLEMWAYVHGIASMIATGFADPDWALISRMLSDAYMGMRKQYGLE
jgi:AcrR family transcriptional regulator